MKRTKVTAAFFTAFLVVAILAGIGPSAVGVDLFEATKPLVDVYNQNIEKIPVITSLIGEERIHAEISMNDGSVLTIGITTDKDAKVTSFVKGGISDPTIKGYTGENTVLMILNADDPIFAFQDALNSGAIRFEGVGLGNKIRIGVMKIGLKLAGLFT